MIHIQHSRDIAPRSYDSATWRKHLITYVVPTLLTPERLPLKGEQP